MGSGEAKRFRTLHSGAGRHGESFWAEEKSNVGLKLLKSMGWEAGQGLGKTGNGCTSHVKQLRKQDNAGIGATAATRDEAFRASQDLFNSVLARLGSDDAADGGGGGDDDDDSPALGAAATTVKGMLARRQLTTRFRRAKDTSQANAADIAAILGRAQPASGADASVGGVGAAGEAGAGDAYNEGLHSGGDTVSGYFARRRRELGLAASSAPPKHGGFTLDEQADFAEAQLALSYSGRGGLGSTSQPSAEREWQPTPRRAQQPQATFAPPPADTGAVAAKVEGSKAKKKKKKENKEERKAKKMEKAAAVAAKAAEAKAAEEKAARKAARKEARRAERKAAKKAAKLAEASKKRKR